MNRRRMLVVIGAVAAVTALSVGGYRLYQALEASERRPVFKVEWDRCEAGDTCVVVPAPCQDWAAVNERHRNDAAAYYNHLTTLIETTELWCPSRGNPTITPYALCVAGQCTLSR